MIVLNSDLSWYRGTGLLGLGLGLENCDNTVFTLKMVHFRTSTLLLCHCAALISAANKTVYIAEIGILNYWMFAMITIACIFIVFVGVSIYILW